MVNAFKKQLVRIPYKFGRSRSKVTAETIAHRRYEEFDQARKDAARKLAESEPDIDVNAALGEIEQKTRQTQRMRKPKGG